MKFLRKNLWLLLTVGAFFMTSAQVVTFEKGSPEEILTHFPSAKKGIVRYVIFLEEKSDESLYKVELIPGKMMKVDCNQHFLIGTIEENVLEGWGYNYYKFSSKGDAGSTLMACPDQIKVNKFVSATTTIMRYNSKIPIVVYAPEGFKLRYKIWHAGDANDLLEK